MEIIHIILGKANPERMNGVNKVVWQLASKQAELGEKVYVWGIAADKEHNFPKRKFMTKLFQKSRNPFAIPQELKQEILRADDEVVFHLHGGWVPVFSSICTFMRRNEKKYIITPHGSYNELAMKKSRFVKKIYFQLFEKKVLDYASKIHNIGKSEIVGVEKFYKNEKNVLLPFGYNSEKIHFENKHHREEIVFGFVGRITIFTKGLDLLVDGFAQFHSKFPKSQLWIIGDGEDTLLLKKRIAQLKIENAVIVFGSKFGEEKKLLLKGMDVFVHPSRNEGLPVSVLEAASFGKPSIVSEATNTTDFIRKYNAGICLGNNTPEEISTAMENLYLQWREDEDLTHFFRSAREMISNEFDWAKVILEMKKRLYEPCTR